MNFSNITNSEHMASEIAIPGLDKSYKNLRLIKDLSSTKMGNFQNVYNFLIIWFLQSWIYYTHAAGLETSYCLYSGSSDNGHSERGQTSVQRAI